MLVELTDCFVPLAPRNDVFIFTLGLGIIDMRHFDMRPFEGCSKSSLSIVNYVLSKIMGIQSLPSPRLLAEDSPSLIQGKELTMIRLVALLPHNEMLKKCYFAGASVTLVPTCVQ